MGFGGQCVFPVETFEFFGKSRNISNFFGNNGTLTLPGSVDKPKHSEIVSAPDLCRTKGSGCPLAARRSRKLPEGDFEYIEGDHHRPALRHRRDTTGGEVPMKVLVSAASKYRATSEIARSAMSDASGCW
jgi:hypothetical protein